MKGYALLMTLLVCCLATPECRKQSTPPRLTPEQDRQARKVIVNYLECEECEDEELAAVVKLGQVAVLPLSATLREGASNADLELLRRQLTARYRDLKEYERTHPEVAVPGSEAEYLKTYMDNYVVQQQSKAATALGAIGGAEARRALEEASRKPLHNHVHAAIKSSLEKMK